jgi:hypothetical protein
MAYSHIGCVWLIHLSLSTFHKWDFPSVPFWKGVLSGDSVPWVVLSPIATGFCLILTVPWFFWQKVLVGIPLPVWVLLRIPNIFYGLCLSSPWQLSWQFPPKCRKLVQVLRGGRKERNPVTGRRQTSMPLIRTLVCSSSPHWLGSGSFLCPGPLGLKNTLLVTCLYNQAYSWNYTLQYWWWR